MRFDDRLATVLARPVDRPADRVGLWRQLVDLLAQRRADADVGTTRAAYARLQELRAEVPVTIRQETARSFSGRSIASLLVAFLASDTPSVAGAILPTVALDQQGWLSVLPRLSPTGRGFLRHRRDLGPVVEAALRSFGATDMQIGGDGAPAFEPSASEPMVPEASAKALLPEPPVFEPSASIFARPQPPSAEPIIMRVQAPIPTIERLGLVSANTTDGVPPPPVQALEHGVGEGQIRAIITRIARFRQDRDPPRAHRSDSVEDAASFRFETGRDGVIRWLDGVPRGPLIGETIAVPASGAYGVDAQAPGAFRRRAPFREARLIVAGGSTASGEWRIAGVPVFAAADGRFQGYRCTARRPRLGERAEEHAEPAPDAAAGLYGAGLAPDSLRQLVHELRTPLNAIGGFAEMIRRQMRGPISTPYRDRAQNIAEQAGRLLAAVDDLDVAARLETQKLDLQRVPVDLGVMLGSICTDHAQAAQRRGVSLACGPTPEMATVTGDPSALRRMIARLVAACTGLADEAETIRVTLTPAQAGELELAVGRPHRLAGQDEAALLDPGYSSEGDSPDAPLLGLGFSLHLVRRLAASAGGTLKIEPDRFLLCLPVAADPSRANTGG